MKPIRLSRAGGELLLRLIDQHPPHVLQRTLDEFHEEPGRELIAAEALVAESISRSITLFDDESPRTIDLIWIDQHNAYGYFSAVDGFVIPDPNSLRLYRADFGWWLRWLSAALNLVNAGKPIIVVPDACWILGDIWVTSRIKVPLVFARRLTSRCISVEVAQSLKKRVAEDGGVLVTSSRQISPVDWPDRFEMKSIQSVLDSNGKEFAIDPAQLSVGWTSPAAQKSNSPISLSPDGRVLTLRGQVLHLSGRVHRSIVRKLFDAYVGGSPIRTKDVLSEAAPTVDTIAKAFRASKHWKVLETVIRSEKGLSFFQI